MAVNCLVVPFAIDGVAGVTEMETSVADVTVNVVEPLTPLVGSVAVIVVVPIAMDVAKPLEPAALLTTTFGEPVALEIALLIVAAPVLDELHVTAVVRSCVVPSVNVPVAVNC